jgi:hypothetical protein
MYRYQYLLVADDTRQTNGQSVVECLRVHALQYRSQHIGCTSANVHCLPVHMVHYIKLEVPVQYLTENYKNYIKSVYTIHRVPVKSLLYNYVEIFRCQDRLPIIYLICKLWPLLCFC